MCGIAGIISPQKNIDEELSKMVNSMLHRGPDNNAIYSDKNVGLAHTRLAIIDLEDRSNQPLMSDCQNYILVFNGEIYNYQDLRSQLESRQVFQTTGDTEVLLYGLKHEGIKFLNKVNGIFSFGLYVKSEGKIILGRDAMGVKPLYFYAKNQDFAFASEIQTLKKNEDFDTSIDNEGVLDYLTFGWSTDEKTHFKYVKRVKEGTVLTLDINSGEYQIELFEDLCIPHQKSDASEAQLIEELDALIHQAVKRQLIADVPIGAFLSGGLDSSLLVNIIQKLQPEIKGYTLQQDVELLKKKGFGDDYLFAKSMAQQNDLNWSSVPSHFDFDELSKTPFLFDEPIGDLAAINAAQIARKAHEEGVKVLLSGTGADDLFTGYRRHVALSFRDKGFDKLSILKKLPGNHHVIRRLKKLIELAGLSENEFMVQSMASINSEESKKLISNHSSYNPYTNLLSQIPNFEDPIDRFLWLEQKKYLSNNNLMFFDKACMSHSIECRVPFLDKDMVKFSWRLPSAMKMKNATTKYLLRKVASKHIDQKIVNRKKTGFGLILDHESVHMMLQRISVNQVNKQLLNGVEGNRNFIVNAYMVSQSLSK